MTRKSRKSLVTSCVTWWQANIAKKVIEFVNLLQIFLNIVVKLSIYLWLHHRSNTKTLKGKDSSYLGNLNYCLCISACLSCVFII